MTTQSTTRRAILAGAASALAVVSPALAISSSPDAELIELGRQWEACTAERDRIEELGAARAAAAWQTIDRVREQSADRHVPDSDYLDAWQRADAQLGGPSQEETNAAWKALAFVEAQIMAREATTIVGLALKARVVKSNCSNLWREADEDADYGDMQMRQCIDAVIALGGMRVAS
jgi:hypothetical protein